MKNALPLLLTAGAIYWLATRKKAAPMAADMALTRLSGPALDSNFEAPTPLTPTYAEISEKKEVEDSQADTPIFSNIMKGPGGPKENFIPEHNSAL